MGIGWGRMKEQCKPLWSGCCSRVRYSGTLAHKVAISHSFASRLVGAHGAVFSLEAMPDNCQTIHLQRRINRCSNWTILQAALWHHSHGIPMDVRGAFTSVVQELSPQPSTHLQSVESIDLPGLLQLWRTPDVIKMDIEGAEAPIFEHLKIHVLPQDVSFMLEIHGSAARSHLMRFAEIHGQQWADLHFQPIVRPPEWGQCLLLAQKHLHR